MWPFRRRAKATEATEPKPLAFTIPQGSESLCFWCRKNRACSSWTPQWEQIQRVGQTTSCPSGEFTFDPTRLPANLNECIVFRRGYSEAVKRR